MPIIEATRGNAGIALAALESSYNHPVYIFMPDWVSHERVNLIKSYGANVYLISKELGIGVGISSGTNLLGSILLTEEIRQNVVTVFADDNKKYLSTELTKNVNTNAEFISNQVQLLSYENLS